MEVNDDMKLTNFTRKPKNKHNHLPGNENQSLVSMGNYIF